jgi:TRAP-type C4-dicarboxylate transport system permease small subunit
MSSIQTAGKVFNWIGIGLWVLSGAILLFAIASVIADVVLRLLPIGHALPWVVEVNEYLLFALTFFSSVWCLRKRGHIRIDFIHGLFREQIRALLTSITNLLGAVACLVFSFYGGYATWYSFVQDTHLFKFLKVPKFYFTLVICLCAFMLAAEFLRQAWENWVAFNRTSASGAGEDT